MKIKVPGCRLERRVPPTTRGNSVQPPIKETLHNYIGLLCHNHNKRNTLNIFALLCHNHTEFYKIY